MAFLESWYDPIDGLRLIFDRMAPDDRLPR